MTRVRPSTSKDQLSLLPLFQDFFNYHRGLLGNATPMSDAEALEIVKDALSQGGSWLVIAEQEETGKILGFVRWEEREGACFGRELFVLPECRGKGIGKMLMAEMEQRVSEAGADALFISVVPQNRNMLAFACTHGYDTLNTVELRKELAGEGRRRDTVTLFGLEFKII